LHKTVALTGHLPGNIVRAQDQPESLARGSRRQDTASGRLYIVQMADLYVYNSGNMLVGGQRLSDVGRGGQPAESAG
jgi:hypothetical protein